MLHVLAGDNQGDPNLASDFAQSKQPLFWIVPKDAHSGEARVSHIPDTGLTARGLIHSQPKVKIDWTKEQPTP